MLQWILGSIYLFELVFLFSSHKYPEVELLDCMMVLFLIFEELPYFVPLWLYQFISHQKCTKISFSFHLFILNANYTQCQTHSNIKALIFALSEVFFLRYSLDWFYLPWPSLKIVTESGSPLFCLSLSDSL